MMSIKREANKVAQRMYRRTRNGTVNDRMYSAKTRAKKKNIFYDLDMEYLVQLWDEQMGLCALSGVEMGYTGTGWASASLDRIDPDKGYAKGNVQWVCWRVNDAKSNMKNEDFITMCRAIVLEDERSKSK